MMPENEKTLAMKFIELWGTTNAVRYGDDDDDNGYQMMVFVGDSLIFGEHGIAAARDVVDSTIVRFNDDSAIHIAADENWIRVEPNIGRINFHIPGEEEEYGPRSPHTVLLGEDKFTW